MRSLGGLAEVEDLLNGTYVGHEGDDPHRLGTAGLRRQGMTYRATAECVMQRVLPVLPGRGPLVEHPATFPLLGTEEHERGRDGEWLTGHCAMACSTARLKLGGSMAGNR